ncbi:hypothetical protein GCM10010293_66940 [Streptomyces griseoflavus]|nr:hypothetical protein GCM10010293_66940 [Streptomyces griseoflavus]
MVWVTVGVPLLWCYAGPIRGIDPRFERTQCQTGKRSPVISRGGKYSRDPRHIRRPPTAGDPDTGDAGDAGDAMDAMDAGAPHDRPSQRAPAHPATQGDAEGAVGDRRLPCGAEVPACSRSRADAGYPRAGWPP